MNPLNSSLIYILPLIVVLNWLTRKNVVINNLILLIAGLVIYAWGNVWWAGLLLVSTALDYALVRLFFSKERLRKAALWVGVLINLAIWMFFKYPNPTSAIMGIDLDLAFPLGLSFYTLRKISYLIISQQPSRHADSFVEYALYVSFLPQLFSGPIEKPAQLLPQIREVRTLDWKHVGSALTLIASGLFRKMIVADNLRIMVNRIFSLDMPSRLLLFLGSLAYAFEILADFSAYTDLSRAAALLLGFETSENFNRPYLALTPQDFWNRWHITFSNWLRDTIFFPLRRWLLSSALKRYSWITLSLPPIITMLFSGIWHGTGWNFTLWGLYYGLLIVIYQALKVDAMLKNANLFQKSLAWLVMFTLITLGWGLFRSNDAPWFFSVWFEASWGSTGNEWIAFLANLAYGLSFILPFILQAWISQQKTWRPVLEPLFYAAALTILIIFIGSGFQDFVYFRF